MRPRAGAFGEPIGPKPFVASSSAIARCVASTTTYAIDSAAARATVAAHMLSVHLIDRDLRALEKVVGAFSVLIAVVHDRDFTRWPPRDSGGHSHEPARPPNVAQLARAEFASCPHRR